MSTHGVETGAGVGGRRRRTAVHEHHDTETRHAPKTTEFMAYVAMTAAVLIAGIVADGFGASEVWLYATILTAGYMISRGLAKSGSHEHEHETHRPDV